MSTDVIPMKGDLFTFRFSHECGWVWVVCDYGENFSITPVNISFRGIFFAEKIRKATKYKKKTRVLTSMNGHLIREDYNFFKSDLLFFRDICSSNLYVTTAQVILTHPIVILSDKCEVKKNFEKNETE